MPLITVALVIIVCGILLWLANSYIPMDGKIKNILNIVVVVALVLWIISLFIGFGSLYTIRVGR